jgi:hypothetical protein
MSDTLEQAQSGTQPAGADTAQDNQADEAGRTAQPGAPEQANDNNVEANDNQADQQQRQSREDRRIAQLSARLAAETRERERLQAEAEAWRQMRQHMGQGEPGEETDEQRQVRLRQEVRGEVEAQLRREQFHADGEAAYGASWRQKCDDLVAMGADPGFALLIVEMPDRVKVTAALADDPEAVQRIAAIRTERGRAIALGKYSAQLDRQAAAANEDTDTPRQPVVPRVTQAPPPVRQVTGRAAPTFDPYSPRHSAGDLYDYFVKQDMERRRRP